MNNFNNYPYYRAAPPPPSKIPPPKKKKIDFICLKKNACTSLGDVEHFLCNFNDFLRYVKLYKLLKK